VDARHKAGHDGADYMVGPNYEFPEPWAEAGQSRDYEIIPITNNGDLYREGYAMHHCVGIQGEQVQVWQRLFLFCSRAQRTRGNT
jgi:hypothetical protein